MPVNILVTEDESIVRKDIERSLKKLGYNVVGTADTGEKAINLAKDLKPWSIHMSGLDAECEKPTGGIFLMQKKNAAFY